MDKEGIRRMVMEFDCIKKQSFTVKKQDKYFVSRVAQLLASIPDKVRPGASSRLSPLYPFVLCSIYIYIVLSLS
jgi:telomere length regulation protein